MTFHEKQIDTESIFEGKIFSVRKDTVELQNGHHSSREVVDHPGGVGIVAITDDNEVILVRQYRYPMELEILEIPAGKLEIGEDPYECAVRELSEETGYSAGKVVDLGAIYPSPGFCRETLYLYLALDLKEGKMHLDDNELLCVEKHDLNKLYDMIMKNEICDAKTVVGVLKAREYRANSISAWTNS